ncbi:YpiF family protein [Oceanobacillus alkalisoli]|uniref:YpiF family protein n=1 Tax=Oceanobacillus alkalisoli TaxID=2925113 RepID=UPI001EF0454D|nr:YpiF family protein [Oceanobacillus alkalisoli]MCF3941630.1 YpiF family protein [Oceanobacillus alkalisoli]MCG5102912.1 YpiF family protein [Oceanobacillus alkalisoli]
MKWRKDDLEKYVQAKEYIDTILVPLVPFQLTNDADLGKNAFQQEVITIFANEIEQELSGRVLLIPSYLYLKDGDKAIEVERLNQWISETKNQPFKHSILLTFDSSWKKHEKELVGDLLWIPGVQTGDIHSKEMQEMIRDQVSQLSEIVRSYW